MSVHGKFERDVEQHEASTATPLRETLVSKLKQMASDGDLAAIKLLLDSPELLNDEKKPELMWEEQKRMFVDICTKFRELAKRGDAEYEQHQFERCVENRLRVDGNALEHRRWQAITSEEKRELWQRILECLREGEDVVLGTTESTSIN